MRGKLFFSAAAAALMLFTPASAQDGDQPGDASTQATFSGEALDGEISPTGDVDWYRMRVEQGRRYSFTLDGIPDADGAALDPMLALYDADGNQLAFNDDAGGTLNSALQYAPSRSGDIFVEARAFSDAGTGAYRLAATSAEVPPDDAGNDANTRARVHVGRSVTGTIEYEGDVDWYRFNARTGNRYRIALSGAEGAATPLEDPFLRVLDSEGGELAVNDDSEGSLNSMLDFVPRSSGDVFIEARAYADAYAGTYTLRVEAERLPTDNYSSDRNTRGRVNVGQTVTSSLDFPTDRDWFRIRLEAGQSYRFTLVGDGGSALGDPLIRLYSPSGEELAMDDDGGEGLNSYLEFTATTSGNHFIEARGFSDDAIGGYALAVYAGDIPADASTDVVLSAGGDYRLGVLSPAGDRDWYRVELQEGQGMRIGLEGAAENPLGDPYLILYGPDGAEVARDDDSGEGLNSWLEYQATATGPHYVEVRGFVEDAQGSYAITLTPGEIGASPDAAEYLAPGGEGRMSMIGSAGDADWFAVDLVEGRPYRFAVDGVEPDPLGDPLLTLYDTEGREVAVDDDGGPGLNSYLSFRSVTGGTYFAAVSSYDGAGTGRYWVRVSDTDVPGNVNTDETLEGSGDDRISTIEMPGDLDYYRVELEGGARYTIELNGHGDTPLADPFLVIADAGNERVASDDDSGPGRNARVRFTPRQSGTYYIQASGLGGSTGGYQVTIVRQ